MWSLIKLSCLEMIRFCLKVMLQAVLNAWVFKHFEKKRLVSSTRHQKSNVCLETVVNWALVLNGFKEKRENHTQLELKVCKLSNLKTAF